MQNPDFRQIRLPPRWDASSRISVNSDPYGDGWMVKIKISNPSEIEDLLDDAAYKEIIGA